MSLKDHNYSPTELLDAVKITHFPRFKNREKSDISVGRALDFIGELEDTGKIFQGDLDGIDALCYHLSKHTIQNAIDVLQKVLNRFEKTYPKS